MSLEQIARDMKLGTFPKKSELTLLEEQHNRLYEALKTAAETILKTFETDEASGFRSRDRQYAITILRAALSQS